MSSRSQHRCARTHAAVRRRAPAACVRAPGDNRVSWNVLCLGMSSSTHPLTLCVHCDLCMSVYVHGRADLHVSPRALSVYRLVLCVLTCCVLYPSNRPLTIRLSMFNRILVVDVPQSAAARVAPRGRRGAHQHLHSKRHEIPYCASRIVSG